jgi:hypothetical protein
MSEAIITIEGESYVRLSSLYEEIEKPLLMAPFYETLEPIIIRRLNYTQIRACGNFSLIETMRDIVESKSRKATLEQMVEYSELQYKILKAALVNPTYDEIMSLNKLDLLRVNAEKELEEIEDIIKELPPGIKKNELMESYYITRMNSEYLLPTDFVTFVMRFALSQDETDIKLVTEEMLFEAAIRSTVGGGSGSIADNLPGNFSDFNKVDIENRGRIIYHKRTARNNPRKGVK